MSEDKHKNCEKHGYTLFKYKKNKKGEWWVCHECLKLQWKKASLKRRARPEVKEYQKKYNKNLVFINISIRTYLTLLTLIYNLNLD